MDDQIDKMSEQFKNLEELQAYNQAQFITINSQSKKINKLENEIKELKQLLQNSIPKDASQISSLVIVADSDEEFICRVQIAELKKVCGDREFTLDEAKRLDIFTKILISLKNKSVKDEKDSPTKMDDAQLMEMLKDFK